MSFAFNALMMTSAVSNAVRAGVGSAVGVLVESGCVGEGSGVSVTTLQEIVEVSKITVIIRKINLFIFYFPFY
jgi:hypothetical protein